MSQQGFHATHEVHVPPPGLDRFIGVEARWVSVVEAEISLIYGPYVMADCSVVTVAEVVLPKTRWQVDPGRDLVRGVPEVDEPH